MSNGDWEIYFEGKDELDCQTFVAAVNRHAFKNGKAKDDEWIAEFGGACFTGAALTWYVGLDDATRDSWKELRKTLLTEYVASLSGRTRNVPTPAAAATPVAPPQVPRTVLSSPSAPGESRIAVISGGTQSWVSRHSLGGRMGITQDISQALHVQPFADDDRLKALNLWGTASAWMGVSWTMAERLGLLVCTANPCPEIGKSFDVFLVSGGGTRTDIWTISSVGEVNVYWTNRDQSRQALQATVESLGGSNTVGFVRPLPNTRDPPGVMRVFLKLEEV